MSKAIYFYTTCSILNFTDIYMIGNMCLVYCTWEEPASTNFKTLDQNA